MGVVLGRDGFWEKSWEWNVEEKGLRSEGKGMGIVWWKNGELSVKK